MNDATSGLIDIIAPTAPAIEVTNLSLTWLVITSILLLLVTGAIWWLRQRYQRGVRKRLRQLQLALLSGDINQQHAAYVLATELAQAYKLKQLQTNVPPLALPSIAHTEWAYLVTTLNDLRYQADASANTTQWARLFSIAESSLRWSRGC